MNAVVSEEPFETAVEATEQDNDFGVKAETIDSTNDEDDLDDDNAFDDEHAEDEEGEEEDDDEEEEDGEKDVDDPEG